MKKLRVEDIRTGDVFENASSERRRVVHVEKEAGVVFWVTCISPLPKRQKAHGSMSLKSFARWASKRGGKTTKRDYEAFARVEKSRREDLPLRARWRRKLVVLRNSKDVFVPEKSHPID